MEDVMAELELRWEVNESRRAPRVGPREFLEGLPKEEAEAILVEQVASHEALEQSLMSEKMDALHRFRGMPTGSRWAVSLVFDSIDERCRRVSARRRRYELVLDELRGRKRRGPDAEEVRESVDVEEVVSRYVPKWRRHGDSLTFPCPFHDDSRPSLSFSVEKKLWVCFGCGRKGNVFQFVMRMENCDFPAALRLLA